MHDQKLKGTEHELSFWRDFVKTPRFLDQWVSDSPTPELLDSVRDFIRSGLRKSSRVLDVGSGVVSILRGTVPEEALVAVDPLADRYKTLFNYTAHGIEPPLTIAAENLEFVSEFDFVHMRNALDHTQNPVRAYEALLRAAKPGGFVIVQGFVNEGSFENWQGMHQWNISINENNHLWIANKQGGGVYIHKNRVSSTTLDLLDTGKKWMVWIAQK